LKTVEFNNRKHYVLRAERIGPHGIAWKWKVSLACEPLFPAEMVNSGKFKFSAAKKPTCLQCHKLVNDRDTEVRMEYE
jgi:hypothetical protein